MPSGESFTISALGKDVDLIDNSFIGRICDNSRRIKLLVPEIATPTSLARALGLGRGRKVLCPVPLVVGLEEPRVVPDFLRDLVSKGWVAVRVNAYETPWMGAMCAATLLVSKGWEWWMRLCLQVEVEEMLKNLRVMGLDWETVRREKNKCFNNV
ncbi:uncharacterized protein LOC112524773 [Cynara cardunculus var. scolymus]|uniref:uncharacterized protein LOC112524773 n=1 Tax=Cynara cardunculus var. scolymus TaxID=59895 RepID=UPI000D62DDD9|nr:uncharacterized protein LOC112524773 [Cynara cardunculus var. scolymus]